MLFCTVALNATRRAGYASSSIEGEGVFDRQGKFVVIAGRDMSLVVMG